MAPTKREVADVTAPVQDPLGAARAALRRGDPAGARGALTPAGAASGEVLECLARASYLEMAFRQAIDEWQQAYLAYRAAGDHVGAVRMARTLAGMYGSIVGDWAVGSGWLARAQRLAAESPETAESGWVALNVGMFEADRGRKEECFGRALDLARRFGDAELEFCTLAYLGASLVHADRPEEGMLLLDEALAAVAGGEVDDFSVLEEIFCQLFSACEYACDVARADQWIHVGEALAARRNLPAVAAFCRTHYGGVLTAAGRWPEADAALTEAVRLWGLGQRSWLRQGALVRLADLRVRQGRVEEAARLLDGIDPDAAVEAARPLAAVHLARGEIQRATDVLERALLQLDVTGTQAAPVLALLVDVHLAADRIEAAAVVTGQLSACAARHRSEHLKAVAALARGRVCLAAGDGDPQLCLREALAGFSRARLPMELARSRLELAAAISTHQPDVALAEARAALGGFERLQAARDVDAAAALLRTLGVRVGAPRTGPGEQLSKREAEVLDLLGAGLSNPEIAGRLFISRKTVEHHVGNILARLGLRSRAEAAAYAARRDAGAG